MKWNEHSLGWELADRLLQCPRCKNVDLIDHYDCLGADFDKLFCNHCNHHHGMIDIRTKTVLC